MVVYQNKEYILSGDKMEIIRFYKQKRILHKYVRWLYDLLADGRFYKLQCASKIKDLPRHWNYGDQPVRFLERMYHCADSFSGIMDENTGEHKLDRGLFCSHRICPVCSIKKSLREYSKLTWQMEHFQEEYNYYFLTLTLPNNPDGFRTEIDLLSSILKDLGTYIGYPQHKDEFHFCSGLYGSYEITKSGYGWHPHLHLVLAYPKKYVADTKTVTKTIKGRERVFENGLQLRWGKRELLLSQDSIMQKYIELIKKKTDVYNARLEDLNFLNIGFQPCYNIEQGVNEMSKYLIDFEALENADDLFVYMYDSYNLRQRVRRGIFRWTPEVKEAYGAFLGEYKNEKTQILYNSGKRYQFKWNNGEYIAYRYLWRVRKVPFTDNRQKVLVIRSMRLIPQYSGSKPSGYTIIKLPDKILRDWYVDCPKLEYEYVQQQLE